MKDPTRIVAGGGWLPGREPGRPRAARFGGLAFDALLVAVVASWPFWDGWPVTPGWLELACGALMLPLPVFSSLALWFRLTEKPVPGAVRLRPNPEHDPRKLY